MLRWCGSSGAGKRRQFGAGPVRAGPDSKLDAELDREKKNSRKREVLQLKIPAAAHHSTRRPNGDHTVEDSLLVSLHGIAAMQAIDPVVGATSGYFRTPIVNVAAFMRS